MLVLLLLLGLVMRVMGQCPSHGKHPCICSKPNDLALEIDCEARGLTSMPDMTVFKGQPIHFLNLAQNDISVLSDHFLDGLLFLSPYPHQDAYIDLSGNPLSSISPDAFLGLRANSLGLRLESCRMTDLPSLALSKMTNWTFLFLHDNQISTLNKDAFLGLHQLRHIELSFNPIKHIHKDTFIDQQDVLKNIHLRNTQLNAIPVDVLQGLSHLQTIDLDDNQISTLPSNGFSKFRATGAMTLCLRRNHLNRIPRDTFAGVSFKLKHLRLDENDLTSLEFLQDYCSYVYSSRPSVTVNDNPIRCTCELFDVIRSDKINLDGACGSPMEYYGSALGPDFLEVASHKCEDQPQQSCMTTSRSYSPIYTNNHVFYALLNSLMFLLTWSVCT